MTSGLYLDCFLSTGLYTFTRFEVPRGVTAFISVDSCTSKKSASGLFSCRRFRLMLGVKLHLPDSLSISSFLFLLSWTYFIRLSILSTFCAIAFELVLIEGM